MAERGILGYIKSKQDQNHNIDTADMVADWFNCFFLIDDQVGIVLKRPLPDSESSEENNYLARGVTKREVLYIAFGYPEDQATQPLVELSGDGRKKLEEEKLFKKVLIDYLNTCIPPLKG